MSEELNPAQKIALEVELRHLEQHLLRVQALMRAPQDGILTRYRPLSPEAVQRLAPLIEDMLAAIILLVEQFDLRLRTEDVGRYVNAVMADTWIGLYDLLPQNLQRYGKVHPSLEESLTPVLQRLIHLTRLASAAAGNQE